MQSAELSRALALWPLNRRLVLACAIVRELLLLAVDVLEDGNPIPGLDPKVGVVRVCGVVLELDLDGDEDPSQPVLEDPLRATSEALILHWESHGGRTCGRGPVKHSFGYLS